MIDEELLNILVCPENKDPLSLANEKMIKKINERIQKQTLRNRGQHLITEIIESGLLRKDQKFLYPIRQNIPILLIDEAIPMEDLLLS